MFCLIITKKKFIPETLEKKKNVYTIVQGKWIPNKSSGIPCEFQAIPMYSTSLITFLIESNCNGFLNSQGKS